ncbi:MAG: hypothetical protein A2V70_08845 [Planctomycetes bacterium RBG_13_63_9]|nr:MAG: hypothetical protein A2V70_08845 [Planctomycetes bacterium RBG_13_63_9]
MVSLHATLAAMALSGAGQTVLYDFSADWCGPCRAMSPTVQALAAKGYPVRQVNIDEHPELAAKYRVRSIPCFVMVVGGKEVDRVVGGTTLSRLERMCQLASTGQPSGRASPTQGRFAGAETSRPAGQGVAVPAVAQVTPFSVPLQETDVAQGFAQTPPVSAPAVATVTPAEEPTPGWTPRTDLRGTEDAKADARLISASVRLRIKDPDGQSCGSGTIIDAREGEALILTCGHIFRDSKGKGAIQVDLFGPEGMETIPARLISYNLDRDVGLVSVRTPGPVTAARVAGPGHKIAKGDWVVSVGCNNGDRPSVRHSQVTSLDKYLGPPNLQVAGLPVEGRSGGGLFSRDGLVIGVCNAADPSDQEGLYAALDTIHAELDQAKLAFVFNSDAEGPQFRPMGPVPRAPLVAVSPPPMPKQMPRPTELAARAGNLPMAPGGSAALGFALGGGLTSTRDRMRPAAGSAPLDSSEQAALDEVRRRLAEGAEVIFVVRSRNHPATKSEIFTLDNASPEFLRQLAAESRPPGLLSTSLGVPDAKGSKRDNSSGAPAWSFSRTPNDRRETRTPANGTLGGGTPR